MRSFSLACEIVLWKIVPNLNRKFEEIQLSMFFVEELHWQGKLHIHWTVLGPFSLKH